MTWDESVAEWLVGFEKELREYVTDYKRHQKIGAEVQRWKYAMFIIGEILGEKIES